MRAPYARWGIWDECMFAAVRHTFVRYACQGVDQRTSSRRQLDGTLSTAGGAATHKMMITTLIHKDALDCAQVDSLIGTSRIRSLG